MPQAASTMEAKHRVVIIIYKLYEIMEKEINIAEILKDKPQGTKLYDWLYNIDIELDTISTTDTETVVWCTNKTDNNTICHRAYSEFGTVRGCTDGLQILLPSKEMRDWSKFAWKRGDVLVSNNGSEVLFENFNNDEYTEFTGRYVLELGDTVYSDAGILKTQDFKGLHDGDKVKDYIAVVEKLFGGKLNLKTLEIEKPQPEFKDGDIVVYGKSVAICRKIYNRTIYFYVSIDETFGLLSDDNRVSAEGYRYATEAEKQQLFDALAKEGKCWNAEKKVIEDIKKEYQFKPFEKVLVRDAYDNVWRAAFFSHIKKNDGRYVTTSTTWKYCIPYEGNESLLGTIKNVKDRYEGNQ